jgi:hypothetical protein
MSKVGDVGRQQFGGTSGGLVLQAGERLDQQRHARLGPEPLQLARGGHAGPVDLHPAPVQAERQVPGGPAAPAGEGQERADDRQPLVPGRRLAGTPQLGDGRLKFIGGEGGERPAGAEATGEAGEVLAVLPAGRVDQVRLGEEGVDRAPRSFGLGRAMR